MRRSGLLLGLAAVGVIGAWSLLLAIGADSDAGSTRDPGVVAAVCAAIEVAAVGEDPRAVFYDRAHDGLHELASEVASQDRAVAGRLLRSKERVEGILEGATGEHAAAALRELEDAASEAVAVVDPSSKETC